MEFISGFAVGFLFGMLLIGSILAPIIGRLLVEKWTLKNEEDDNKIDLIDEFNNNIKTF